MEYRYSRRRTVAAIMLLIMTFLPVAAQERQPSAPVTVQPEQKSSPDASPDNTGGPQSEPLWRMQEQVVTPTMNSEMQFVHPYSAHTVSQQQMQNERMARSTPEALKEVPGVAVQKTAYGQGSPYIRGFTGFRTLFLLDGIRLNNSVFREGPNQYWNTVDYLAIDRMEVVKGPASTLYGSDAIGGTVNAITRHRTRYEEPWEINPHGYYRFASSGRSSTVRGELSANYEESLGALGGFYYKYFGDLEAGSPSNELPRTGYYEWGGDLHCNWFLSENAELEFAYYLIEQNNVWRTHRTIYGKSFHGTTVGTDLHQRYDQDRQLGYISLNLSDANEALSKVKLTVSWQLQKEAEDRVRSNHRRDAQEFAVNTLGLQAQATSETPVGQVSYGVEYYRDFVDSTRTEYNADGSVRAKHIQGPVADDANYDLLGIYVQDEFTLLDVLTVTIGGRYTHAWLNANQVEDPLTSTRMEMSDNWGEFSGNLRISALVEKHWRVFGGISQGFRAPNLSDLSRFDTARSNEIETPVRNLDPENFLQYEIGAKASYDSCYLQASYYYTQIFNMIIRYPTGRIISGYTEVTKDDDGDGFVHGVELEGGYQIAPEWLVHGSFSWMEGIVSNYPTANSVKKDSPIDKMQPATGLIGIRWTHTSKKYWAEGLVTMVRHQHRLSPGDKLDTQRIPPGGTPGYAVVTLRGGVKINDHVTVSASLENLGDKDYRVHGSGQNESGLNAILAIDAGF